MAERTNAIVQIDTAWIGTGLQITGATMMAMKVGDPYFAYVVMFPGAVILAFYNAHHQRWHHAALFAIFTAINIMGIWNWGAGS